MTTPTNADGDFVILDGQTQVGTGHVEGPWVVLTYTNGTTEDSTTFSTADWAAVSAIPPLSYLTIQAAP